MAKSMSSVVFLLVFLVVMNLATMALSYTMPSPPPQPSPASVKIYNQITVNSPIQVHCISRTNREVIPETTLQNGQYVGWGLKPSIMGYTRFKCDFKWGALRKHQAFDVWHDAPRPCTHCVWHVVMDGFKEYEATGVLGNPVAEHPWLADT